MKLKVFILVAIIFYSVGMAAQTVTFNDLLQKSKCSDFECFNDFITKKGFSLSDSDDNFYLYLSDKTFTTTSTSKITTKNTSIILFGADGSITVGTRTAVISQYNSLRNQIKTAGFSATKTENADNGVVNVYYKSAKYPKILVLIRTDKLEKEGLSWTSYDISLTRTK